MLGSRDFYCIFDTTGEIFEFEAKWQRDRMCEEHHCRIILSKDAHQGQNWKKIVQVRYHDYDEFIEEFENTHEYVQLTFWDLFDSFE